MGGEQPGKMVEGRKDFCVISGGMVENLFLR